MPVLKLFLASGHKCLKYMTLSCLDAIYKSGCEIRDYLYSYQWHFQREGKRQVLQEPEFLYNVALPPHPQSHLQLGEQSLSRKQLWKKGKGLLHITHYTFTNYTKAQTPAVFSIPPPCRNTTDSYVPSHDQKHILKCTISLQNKCVVWWYKQAFQCLLLNSGILPLEAHNSMYASGKHNKTVLFKMSFESQEVNLW